MNSEQIDLFVEEIPHGVYIRISGTFGFTQLAPLREKVMSLLKGPGKIFFLDVDKARFCEEEYITLFLNFLEKSKEKDAELVLVFSGEANKKFFSAYAHVFTITQNWKTYHQTGILGALRAVGVSYSKQTGIRLSPIIAIILLLILAGWFFTLYGMIRSQNAELQLRETRLLEMDEESQRLQSELDYLQSVIGPLKNLGLVVDSTTSKKSEARIRSWTKYLDRLEERRRER